MLATVRLFARVARHTAAWVAAVAVLIADPCSAAAEPTPAEVAVARRLFQDAVEFEQREDWEGAEAKLREAITLKDTPGLRYHLAFCEERQGRLVEAMVNYDRAAEMIASGTAAPDVEALLEPARSALAQRTPMVRLDVPPDVEAPAIALDGKSLSPTLLGREVPVDPGLHTLEVTAPGRVPWRHQFDAAEEARLAIMAELELVPAPPPQPAPVPIADGSAGPSTRTVVLVGEVAVTLGGVALALVGNAKRQSASDDFQSIDRQLDREADERGVDPTAVCAQPQGTAATLCDQRTQALDDRHSATTLRTVGLIAGGVGVAALITTWFAWPAAGETPSAARAAVYPIAGGWAFACGGTF